MLKVSNFKKKSFYAIQYRKSSLKCCLTLKFKGYTGETPKDLNIVQILIKA